jgi:hypothetical protein
MAKRRVRSQTTNLTPDQKKSKIDPIYLVVDDVRPTVRKLLTRTTTLLQTAPQFKVCSQSYGAPKLWESQLARFRDSHSKVSGEKSHLNVVLWRGAEYNIRGKVVASPSPSRGESCVSVLPVSYPSTKGAPTMH